MVLFAGKDKYFKDKESESCGSKERKTERGKFVPAKATIEGVSIC